MYKFQHLYDVIKFTFKKGYFVDIHPDLYQTSFEELSEYFVDYVNTKYRLRELRAEFLCRNDAESFEKIWGLNYTSNMIIPKGWAAVVFTEYREEVDMWIASYIKGKWAYIVSSDNLPIHMIIFEIQAEAAMFKLTWLGR